MKKGKLNTYRAHAVKAEQGIDAGEVVCAIMEMCPIIRVALRVASN